MWLIEFARIYTNKFLLILFFLPSCILVDIEANLQTNLIPRKEALDRISNVSLIRIVKCLDQKNQHPIDLIQINDYTNYLSCNGSCSGSVYYREKDIKYLYDSLLILPCDTDSLFLIPKVNAFEPNDFELKYFGF
ncbi:hypothetical protein CH362_03780 [Leptospira saintgironsiae]|uniref:Uncharacterized protein n=1 Tax=Leptospira saintgironsiae TaxID=2023183 RepID=A0A2M9YH62_9LEPT|nr:hypothetical protein CH362_03780 [Leptospira saintgironsiae]